MELLKQGDFVIVYDKGFDDLQRGIVIQDEEENSQVNVAVARSGFINQNYYDRKLISKAS